MKQSARGVLIVSVQTVLMVSTVELEMCSKGHIVVIILDVARYLTRCKFSFKKGAVYPKLNTTTCTCAVK